MAGRHSGPPRTRRGWIIGGLTTVGATVVALSLTLYGTAAAPAAAHANATGETAVSQQLSASQLEHLTPTQNEVLNQALGHAFAKLGMRAGVSAHQSDGTTLTSYDWSVGASWDHAWVTASYANLKPYADAAIGIANVINRQAKLVVLLSNLVCAGIGLAAAVVSAGVGAIAGLVCGTMTGYLAYLAAEVHGPFPGNSNHGVWAQYYWVSGYHTPGGYW
jgi:hypothetical protein